MSEVDIKTLNAIGKRFSNATLETSPAQSSLFSIFALLQTVDTITLPRGLMFAVITFMVGLVCVEIGFYRDYGFGSVPIMNLVLAACTFWIAKIPVAVILNGLGFVFSVIGLAIILRKGGKK